MLSNRSSGLLGMAADPGLVSMLAGMEKDERQDYVARHSDDINVVIMGKIVSDIANKLDIAKKGKQSGTNPTVLAQTIAAMGSEPQRPFQGMPQGPQQGPQQGPPQGMPPQGMPPQGMPQAPQAMPQQGPQAPQAMPPQMAADGGYMDSRLPEEMGIGVLPERSLSNMADGGIVGFADRGLVPDLPGGAIERARRAILEKRAAEDRLTPRRGYMTPPAIYDQDTQNAYQQPQETPANVAQQTALPPALPPAAPAAPPPAAAPRPAAPPAARPAAATPTGAPPAAATGIQTLLTSPDLTPEAITKMRADLTAAQPAVVDSLKGEREKIVAAEKASGLEELQQHRDRVAKQGDPYAKQEERANKQEASVAESAERNPYLSIMEAGFAAMAGDSPYAMVNLGKGALAGTKTYREGLALIEKAKEKLTESRDRIDGLRLIRSDLNASEERTILNQNRKIALDGTRFMFEGLAKATGESKAQIEANLNIIMAAKAAKLLQEGENARAILKDTGDTIRNRDTNVAAGIRNAASNSSAEKIAGMPGATQKLLRDLGDGDIVKGYAIYNEKTQYEDKLFMDWSKRAMDPLEGAAFKNMYPTPKSYVDAARGHNLLSPQEEALVNKFAPKK